MQIQIPIQREKISNIFSTRRKNIKTHIEKYSNEYAKEKKGSGIYFLRKETFDANTNLTLAYFVKLQGFVQEPRI